MTWSGKRHPEGPVSCGGRLWLNLSGVQPAPPPHGDQPSDEMIDPLGPYHPSGSAGRRHLLASPVDPLGPLEQYQRIPPPDRRTRSHP